MLYTIADYNNIYGIETPMVLVVSNVSTNCNFPFVSEITNANISIYVDSVEFRKQLKDGISGESMVLNIQPIETKYINLTPEIASECVTGSELYYKTIISVATNTPIEKILTLVI